MPQVTQQNEKTQRWAISTGGWDTEKWVAVVVLGALALLIAIRMGFRGIDVMGASVRVS
jgi:hypothetical protein